MTTKNKKTKPLFKYSDANLEIESLRLERRSIFFLKIFSIFWISAVTLFLINPQSNSRVESVWANLVNTISSISSLQNLVSFILFSILLVLISSTIIGLSKCIVVGIASVHRNPHPINALVNKKNKLLNSSVRSGLLASSILIFYGMFLLSVDSPAITEFFTNINSGITYLLPTLALVITPIGAIFFELNRDWDNSKIHLKIASLILDVYTPVIYLFNQYQSGNVIFDGVVLALLIMAIGKSVLRLTSILTLGTKKITRHIVNI